MKLKELIHAIWKDERIRELGIRKSDVDKIVKVTIEQIVENLFKHNVVKLRGLFTIRLKKANGRKVKHPVSGEIVKVDDYYKLDIKPSKNVKDKLEEIRYR